MASASRWNQKKGRGGLSRLLPTKTFVFGVTAKNAMLPRRIKLASFLLPRTAKLTTRRFIAPGMKSKPPNLSAFKGDKEATIVPMKTANTPYSGSIKIPIMGVTIPLAVMEPEVPMRRERGISRKRVYMAASDAVRVSFLVSN